ncbi:MAG: DNA polymerase III subunit chi [Rhodoferax sp.]
MTQVAFHFGASNRLAYSCRLLRKVAASGMRALVVVPDSELALLDEGLWAVGATDFVPHATLDAPEGMRQRSAVLLSAGWPQQPVPGVEVLVNLAPEYPAQLAWFTRVVEVVSADGPDRDSARDKWRRYSAQGHSIQRHDLQRQEAGA